MHPDNERDRHLKPFFEAVHRDDPPPFGQVWSAARHQAESGRGHRSRPFRAVGWALSGAAASILLVLWARTPSERPELVETLPDAPSVERVVMWRGPLDFLLDTPGRELLGTVPDLDGAVPAPVLDPNLL